MTDRELRKLSRRDLLELLIQQDEEMEALKKRLKEAEYKLESRTIAIDTAGSIAEASVSISGVLEAAQDAAARYLENVEAMRMRQEKICIELEANSRREAEDLLAKTKEDCRRMEEDTLRYCEQMRRETEKDLLSGMSAEDYWVKRSGQRTALSKLAYSS